MEDYIVLKGCKENNLKNVSLKIPKRKITVFTGVSGSGKSSLVFDTIAQEAGRQLNENFSNLARLFLPRYSQPNADSIENLSAAIVINQQKLGGNVRSTLGTISDINTMLRVLFSRFGKPYIGYGNSYSFNDPEGMCPVCEGIGKTLALDINSALDKEKTLKEGAILLPGFKPDSVQWSMYAGTGFFDIHKKIKDYSEEEFYKLVYAQPEKIKVNYMNSEMTSTYEGLAVKFYRQNMQGDKENSKNGQSKLEKFAKMECCPECLGKRYNQRVLESKIMGYSIYDLTDMQINELIPIIKSYDEYTAKPLITGIIEKLKIFDDIGLGYIKLTRETTTLSGGESQRVKIAKHLTSSLTDMLYIFDEPSIGLHPSDVNKLNELLIKLRDKGNTVLVVEHDPEVIKMADFIIDMGPMAGSKGGRIVYSGDYDGLYNSDTITGSCLRRNIEVKQSKRSYDTMIECKKSSLHNLKDISLRIPKGVFTVITGVAGSGKSTLVNEVFAKEFPEAVQVDQNPAVAGSRSNPSTYTGIMDKIRKCFSDANNANIGLFSYNSLGACESCKGTGIREINLSFLDKMEVICETCNGKRFKNEVQEYKYKGKSISAVMELTIEEAAGFFEEKEIRKNLKNMIEVGLAYITLGQPLNTLSGGECQRIKLAKELSKKGNLYILDEPTTGLHMSDIQNLLSIIEHLVCKGNTVIVIEHNIEVIKNADWVIDLGPGCGALGGRIIFEGNVNELKSCRESITALYL